MQRVEGTIMDPASTITLSHRNPLDEMKECANLHMGVSERNLDSSNNVQFKCEVECLKQQFAKILPGDRNGEMADEYGEERELCGEVVLRTSPPYAVQSVNDAFVELMGFQRMSVVGRSMRLMQGPASDKEVLEHLVDGTQNEAAIVLYNVCGDEMMLTVRSQHTETEDQDSRVTLYFSKVHAITYAQALKLASEDTGVIVGADMQCVEYISNLLLCMLGKPDMDTKGMCISELMGFQGTPNVDMAYTFAKALGGSTQSLTLQIPAAGSPCHLKAVPVLSDSGFQISHLLVFCEQIACEEITQVMSCPTPSSVSMMSECSQISSCNSCYSDCSDGRRMVKLDRVSLGHLRRMKELMKARNVAAPDTRG